MKRSRRGFSLVELLVASVVATIGIAGMATAWMFNLRTIGQQRLISVAGQIARTEVENAKALGFANLPLGTLSGSTGTHTSSLEYYTIDGVKTTSTTNRYYSVQRVTTDTNVTAGSGTAYTLNDASRRAVVVTVRLVSDNSILSQMGTIVVRGGV
ncbi:MAG: type II secretion system protein [Fimbriimonadaceae bacterium]|nr:type II secretion system protein [Fimbriimonadaceae bacterium]